MSDFRDSSLDELFGPSRLNEPPVFGSINWKQVAIQSALTVLIASVPVVVGYSICKKNQEKILLQMQMAYDEKLDKLKAEHEKRNEEIINELFNKRSALT